MTSLNGDVSVGKTYYYRIRVCFHIKQLLFRKIINSLTNQINMLDFLFTLLISSSNTASEYEKYEYVNHLKILVISRL